MLKIWIYYHSANDCEVSRKIKDIIKHYDVYYLCNYRTDRAVNDCECDALYFYIECAKDIRLLQKLSNRQRIKYFDFEWREHVAENDDYYGDCF